MSCWLLSFWMLTVWIEPCCNFSCTFLVYSLPSTDAKNPVSGRLLSVCMGLGMRIFLIPCEFAVLLFDPQS